MPTKIRVKIDPALHDQRPNFAQGLALIYLTSGEPEPYRPESTEKRWFSITLKDDAERKFLEIQKADRLNNKEIIERALWAIKKRYERRSSSPDQKAPSST